MILNKAQAAKALGISLRTLCNRMKDGSIRYTKLQGTKVGEPSVFFTYEQLGLPEPVAAPAPVHDVQIAPQYEDPKPAFVARPVIDSLAQKISEDLSFAVAYREGRATDSLGNRIDGTNTKFPTLGPQSLLGPVEIDHGPPPETQSHMTQGLLATNDHTGSPVEAPRWAFETNPEGFTRSGRPLAVGFSQDAYDAAMRDWHRRGGGRSESEMEQASRRAIDNINRSFPRG